MNLDINWEIFEPQEQEGIKRLLEMRMPEHLASVIINMDKSKEAELQKITSEIRPLNSLSENEIRNRVIDEYYKKNPRGPQSPDEEKVLQDQLDSELLKFHNEQRAKAELNQQLLDQSLKKEVKPFCEKCDSKGVRHKRECPTNQPEATPPVDNTILNPIIN